MCVCVCASLILQVIVAVVLYVDQQLFSKIKA